jgi:hypothetical protein
MSFIGGAMAIGSIAMAPATAGLSLFIGTALGIVGGVTLAGASIADILIQKSNVKQAQQQLGCDYEHLYAISALAIAIQSKIDDEHAKQQYQGISTDELVVELGLALTQGIFRISNIGMKMAEVFATTLAAVKTSGTVPASTAIVKSLGQTLSSLPRGALAPDEEEAVGSAIRALQDRTAAISEAGDNIAARAGGSRVVQGLAGAGVVLNIITIPINLIEIIIQNSNSLVNAIEQLTTIVKQLEKEKEAIALVRERQDQIIKEHAQK